MKGVILAAGKGTRLYPVTHHVPKPLLPLANRPTLHYAIDRLKEIGITDICVVVGENEPQMRAALGDGRQLGVSLDYARQTEPKGLAHAVGYAKDFVGDQPFALYLGDAIYSKPLTPYANRFLESGCANLNLVQPVEDPTRYGVANLDGERIVKLVEKPKQPESNLAMAGLYFFRPELWAVLPDLQPSARGEYEITDAIQMMIDRDEVVLAGIYDGVWYDTGTLDSFLDTSGFLIGRQALLGQGAKVHGAVGHAVVVGDDASVECESIADSVVLPGSRVRVKGPISHCVIGGSVQSDAGLAGQILYGE